MLHLSPVRGVDVRRQDHQAGATGSFRFPGQRDGAVGGEVRDGRDDGCTLCDADGGLEDGDLLVVLEGCAFADRAKHHEALASVAELPCGMLG